MPQWNKYQRAVRRLQSVIPAAFRAVRDVWHGLLVCVIVALSAAFLASQYQVPVLLIALLLGMSSGFLAENDASRAGVEFAAGTVLRWGVALLGFRILAGDLAALGWSTVAMLSVGAGLTIVSGILLARVLKLDGSFGALSGGAVAFAVFPRRSPYPPSCHEARPWIGICR